MAILTVEELRALGDPKVDEYLEQQAKLTDDLNGFQLTHMAESFGRPGSLTEGGQKYRSASLELKALTYEFVLYSLVKGYAKPEDYAEVFE